MQKFCQLISDFCLLKKGKRERKKELDGGNFSSITISLSGKKIVRLDLNLNTVLSQLNASKIMSSGNFARGYFH